MRPCLIAALLTGSPAFAASDEAWAAFEAEVRTACLAAVPGSLDQPVAIVDPFGSESHGLALIGGRMADGGWAGIICVLDKKTRQVELGGELDLTALPSEPAQPGPEALTPGDVEALSGAGELSCGFEAGGQALLFAAGDVGTEAPARAVIRWAGSVASLQVEGGFDGMIDGADFTGPGITARITPTGPAEGGGESPPRPARMTLIPTEGAEVAIDGLWTCGP